MLRAQATERRQQQQDGGVVTGLLAFMLERGHIDGAVVTTHGLSRWQPSARLATTVEDILASAGTIYSRSPIVRTMMQAFAQGKRRLAVVGTPCDIAAVSKMKMQPAGVLDIGKSLSVFSVGLFCTEAFDYSRLSAFLQQNNISIDRVDRFTISRGVLRVTTPSGSREWHVKELSGLAARACQYCRDFTCHSSDLSCGGVGSMEGWTTVLVRTEQAERMLEEALEAGVIRTERLTDREIRRIEDLARLKMMRASSVERRTDDSAVQRDRRVPS